ncbi:MAG: DMT family transporter [Bacteroidetes bacterium]|nr:DMT family transporter [Bacteroidota bacterium]MBS1591760.1 DMT family transporter [Bacteroidota bacterium]
MGSKAKAHIAILIANFFFGSCIVAVKHLTQVVMQPLALNFLRLSCALILFWLMFLIKPTNASIKKKHVFLFFLCGLTGVAINQVFFIKGASLTSPVHTSLLALVTPIVLTIIAVLFLGEKLLWNILIGLLLGISGAVILILLKNNDSSKDSNMLGDFYVILNATSYAIYLAIVKPLMDNYKPIHVIRWVFLFASIIVLPIAWDDFTEIKWQLFNWTHWLSLIVVVLGATFIAYLFIVYGIATLGASVVGAYVYTQPVFATITAIILYNEKLSTVKLIAAIFIFGGVYLVNYKKKLSAPEAMECVD